MVRVVIPDFPEFFPLVYFFLLSPLSVLDHSATYSVDCPTLNKRV